MSDIEKAARELIRAYGYSVTPGDPMRLNEYEALQELRRVCGFPRGVLPVPREAPAPAPGAAVGKATGWAFDCDTCAHKGLPEEHPRCSGCWRPGGPRGRNTGWEPRAAPAAGEAVVACRFCLAQGRPPHVEGECPHHNLPAAPAPESEGRCPECKGDGFTVGQGDRFGEPWCPRCGGSGRAT